ncbi:ricin B lectin [Candidatus Vecturithrix granuli]|uniref:Ricin B lectin n=1 Tax=Vecturithrix granuli TaxID=1499967 RepID=A0A081C890_VECG1|nr:ricin B lectin [Candidatus Vecturithrix granuli]
MTARRCMLIIVAGLFVFWIPVQATFASEIRSGNGKKCMMVAGEEQDGMPVQLSRCDGSSAQQWYFANNEIHSSSGLCLDTNEVNQVNIWSCTGETWQKWTHTRNSELQRTADRGCLETASEGAIIVSICTKSFKLTSQAFKKLEQNLMPPEIIDALQELKNQEFKGEKEFLKAVKEKIGDEGLNQYKDLILDSAYIGNTNPNQKWKVQ